MLNSLSWEKMPLVADTSVQASAGESLMLVNMTTLG